MVTLIWMDGRETDHDPLSLGLAAGIEPPAQLLLFNNTTRCRLHHWNVGHAVYEVIEYNHEGVAA